MENNNKRKIELCKNWTKNECKYSKDKCNFAHGEDDLLKKYCLSGEFCYNENCNYNHPKEWNPYNNKKECIFCLNGYCNKENNKYNHKNISKNISKNNEEVILNIPENEDFPEIIKSKYTNNINKDMNKYNLIDHKNEDNKNNLKEIEKNIKTKLNINKDNNEDNLINIKKQLKENYILLSKLDQKKWENYEEVDDIKYKINNLEKEYNKNKNRDEKENIENDILNLDTIFNENYDNKNIEEEDNFPNVKLTINGIEFDNYINNESTLIIEKDKKVNNNIKTLINNMEKYFKIYNEKIKNKISYIIKDDHIKFILINNLNEISSIIDLFRNNCEDNNVL